MPRTASSERLVRRVLPLLFFLAWAVAFTYPLALHLGDSVALLRGGDAWLHMWDLWWVDKSLAALHQNPYQTNYLYYPTGLNLYYHSLDLLNGLVSIPLQHLFGLTASFNLLMLANLTLDGLTAYWLCLERTHSRPAALVGGALFGAAPLLGTSVDLGQLDEVTAWWIPLYILALWRALDSPGPVWRAGGGRRATLCASLCLAGASLATWYFTTGLAVFTIAFVPTYLWVRRRQTGVVGADHAGPTPTARQYTKGLLNAGGKVVGATLLFVGLLSPLLAAMVRERLSGATYMLPALRTTVFNSADLAALFAPPRLDLPALNAHNSTVALGYVALFLAALALSARGKALWPLGVAVAALLLMSLGPQLQVAGNDTGLPMPYALLNHVPLVGASRQPLRVLATAGMALSLLAAFGFAWLLSRLGTPSRRRLATGLAVALAALELFGLPRQLQTTQSGPAYSFLRNAQEQGAVLELPYGEYSALSLLHQTRHERPIVGGYTSRHFPYPFADAAPGIAQLVDEQPAPLLQPDILVPPVADTALASLSYYKVRYVVVHKADLATGRYGSLEQVLAMLFGDTKPVFEDSSVAVYDTPGAGGAAAGGRVPLVGLGSGWHAVEPEPVHRWTGANGTDGDALVWVGIPPEAAGKYRLAAVLYSYQAPRHVEVEIDGKVLARQEIGTAFTKVSVDLGYLPEGNHLLRLKVQEPPENPPGDERKLAIGSTRIAIEKVEP